MSHFFRKIESGEIFTRDFSPLVNNNEIQFPTTEEIVLFYGPNGTGKTSLIKVLSDARDTKVEFSLDGTEYHKEEEQKLRDSYLKQTTLAIICSALMNGSSQYLAS